MADETKIN